MLDLNKALDFAVETVREAGAVLRDYYRRGVTVKYKGEIDLITEADHASEALILQRIRSAYPDCAILAEDVIKAAVADYRGKRGKRRAPDAAPVV